MTREIFALRLKELMEIDGISRRALCVKININKSAIIDWLKGNNYPEYYSLIKLAIVFNVRIAFLLGMENDVTDIDYLKNREVPSTEDIKENFLKILRNYMAQNNLTAYVMAKKIKIDQTSLKRWFTKGSMPETGTIIRLAKEMNISVDELLGLEGIIKG